MAKSEMKVVALGQQKGGVGKSAAAINLACQAIAAGHKAAIIDMDSDQGTTRKWRERRNGKDQPDVSTGTVGDLEQTLQRLKAAGTDWVFLDLPGRAAHVASAGIKASDIVIIPCRPVDVDIEASIDTVTRVTRGGKRYAYLMNIAPSQNDMQRAKQAAGFLRAHGHAVADPIIVQRIEVPDAIAEGLGVNEYKPKSTSAKEFADLFAWLVKEVRKK
jgi:chromosome partitioning protein